MLDHDIFSELLKSITLGTSNVLKQLLTLSEGTDRRIRIQLAYGSVSSVYLLLQSKVSVDPAEFESEVHTTSNGQKSENLKRKSWKIKKGVKKKKKEKRYLKKQRCFGYGHEEPKPFLQLLQNFYDIDPTDFPQDKSINEKTQDINAKKQSKILQKS